MTKLIAALDDEEDLLELLRSYLSRAGFVVETFSDPDDFLGHLPKKRPDLILLDLMLPGVDGLEICRYLRKTPEYSTIPIIILTAKSQETDRIVGLELGADDYVTKPFSLRELEARIKAVLRRQEITSPSGAQPRELAGGAIVLDLDNHLVKINGQPVALSPTEFKLLDLLTSRRGRVFTRDQILDHLWSGEKVVIPRTVDVHIRHLREKLGSYARFIKNVRGFGYKYEEN